QASNGRPSALHLARAVPLQGGMPIVHDGHVVGGVGVSGASSADEDQELAALAAAAIAGTAGRNGNGRAKFFTGEELRQKFETGGLLLDTSGYKIDAGRRSAPGGPELHEHEVDVMHVLRGRATVVTGGAIRDGAIEGGETREVGEGDVVAIPNGVPHQFTDVSDPLLYFVVKVEA